MVSVEAKKDNNIRVLIVTEISLMGDVIDTLISSCGAMTVTGRAATVSEALNQINNCDVVLISAALSGNGTFKLVRIIAAEHPEVKTLVIGLPTSTPIILFWLETGASGYVLQTEPGRVLLETIQAVYHNRSIISPEVAAALINRVAELARGADQQ